MPNTFVDSYGELDPIASKENVVLTIPAHDEGDVAIVFWTNSRDSYGDDVYTMSEGWTKQQMDRAKSPGFNKGQTGIYTKRLNGTETEATLVHNDDSLTGLRGSFMMIFRGIDGDDPIDRIVMIEDAHGLLLDAQDETDFVTFVGGTGYTALDVLTLSCGSLVTVDAVDSGGVVTEFTVDSTTALSGHEQNAVVAATGGTGNDDFTLTAAQANMSWNPNDSTPHPASITTTVANGVLLLVTMIESTGYSAFGNPASVAGLVATPISNNVPMGVRHIGRVVATYKLDAGAAQTYTFVSGTNDYTHTTTTGRILKQDQTSYDNAPTTEGTYTQGSGYAVDDIITFTGGGRVLVNAVDSGGAVTEFSVTDAAGDDWDTAGHTASDTLSQTGVEPPDSGKTGFSLTVDTDNLGNDSAFGGFRQYSISLNPTALGNVYINDAATLDGGEVLQTYPGLSNWSDSSIDMQAVIDTTGLSGQLYLIVERADGLIASRAITVSAAGGGGTRTLTLLGVG